MTNSNWELDPKKFMSKMDVEKLLATAECRTQSRHEVAIRDYFVIRLGLATGLRVMEIAALNCDDLSLKDQIPSLIVREGKGKKRRRVFFNCKFKEVCQEYIDWKEQIGEPVGQGSPLVRSSNTGGHMTTRALQKAFKRCAKSAELPSHYSIHCLRHTYACFLLKASNWNLRLVQKQLGHSKITTTQVYADVMMPELKKALDRLNF